MPGLVVTTGVRVGSTGTADAPSSSMFIVGSAERGPTDDYRLIESSAVTRPPLLFTSTFSASLRRAVLALTSFE
jgi:hypothetical protein